MLELKNISKTYKTSDIEVQALKDIDISFRNKEFVSILGKSGSGKTTLLNIIGGLDNYTDGNLIINGKSTKKFKDKDWDSYRNHKVGFVFQSYNLISHQTALSNVELALTLSGVSKELRRKRAIDALEKVGLKEQINKKPGQMSGGQMQRIAIARALVNDPDIILADEPTGALDTVTSKQIMDILKEISKTKLVIMVTHNPDLAEEYSTRIINLSDGKILSDSNPNTGKTKETKEKSKTRKTYMSFKTALSLSFNNLRTKKARTILTAFAGAIGIIGIALVLSISNGVDKYINSVEEDTLSSYPITIEAEQIDANSLLETMSKTKKEKVKEGTIKTNNIMGNMMSLMSQNVKTNDLRKFKKYLEKNNNIKNNTNAISYSYDLDLQVYKDDLNNVVKLNPNNLFSMLGYDMPSMYSSMTSGIFSELFDNEELLNSQYTILKGHMPEKYDEIVLIVDKNSRISDFTAYSLGLKDSNELTEAFYKITGGQEVEFEEDTYNIDDLLKLKFKVLLNSDYYEKNGDVWKENLSDSYIKSKLKNALEIKVVGIIKPNDNSVISSNNSYGTIGYSKDLTNYVINKINDSEVVKTQVNNKNINVLTGKKFSNSSLDDLSIEQKKYLASLSGEEANKYIQSISFTYDSVLRKLGSVDIDSPSVINIYPKDFNSKDLIKDIIDEYNDNKQKNNKDDEVISYTDYVGLLMSSVTTIVDVISYVLIAFVSVSLVVSSIMIGIITYISVLERTKEIGILRAIGASKKDISRVFNAETFIVGLLAGIIGIGVTLLLNIPINIIIKNLANIDHISSLPVIGAIILVIISVGLTVIAGLIPSKMASKKDPVEALRSE